MLLIGCADLVYKRGAVAGAPAHQFLMVQTWVFLPTVTGYALLSGSLPLVAGSLWGTAAGGFMLLGAYLFARSLVFCTLPLAVMPIDSKSATMRA